MAKRTTVSLGIRHIQAADEQQVFVFEKSKMQNKIGGMSQSNYGYCCVYLQIIMYYTYRGIYIPDDIGYMRGTMFPLTVNFGTLASRRCCTDPGS